MVSFLQPHPTPCLSESNHPPNAFLLSPWLGLCTHQPAVPRGVMVMGVFTLEPSPLGRNLLENRGPHCSPVCAQCLPHSRPRRQAQVGGRAKRDSIAHQGNSARALFPESLLLFLIIPRRPCPSLIL